MEYGPLGSLSHDDADNQKQRLKIVNSEVEERDIFEGKILKLEGHQDAITCAKFSPDGQLICSGSRDNSVFVWQGRAKCDFIASLNTRSPILDLEYKDYYDGDEHSQNLLLFTAQSTGLVSVWDLNRGSQLRRLGNSHSRKFAHKSVVNSITSFPDELFPNLLCSASDDRCLKVWDLRSNQPVAEYQHSFELTSCVALKSGKILVGGVDGLIHCLSFESSRLELERETSNSFNARNNTHSDLIFSLSLSHSNAFLSSCSPDKSLKIWNCQPFVPSNQSRFLTQFYSQFNNIDMDIFKSSWNCNDSLIALGGSKLTFVWDVLSSKLLCALPGHQGNVTCCHFHPSVPNVILSAGTDALLFVNDMS